MSLDIPASGGDPSKEERWWAVIAHLGTLVGFIPFANIVVPLVVWFAKRDESGFIGGQAKESLNFQITMMLGYLVALAVAFTVVLIPLAILMVVVLPIMHLVFSMIAAIKSYDGIEYRYPFTLRLI
jgi:hypothetical protein